jgi:hypothetical protein
MSAMKIDVRMQRREERRIEERRIEERRIQNVSCQAIENANNASRKHQYSRSEQ